MPGENLFISNWQKELDALKKHLNEWKPGPTEEIHKIRINIKKLRAYLKLYILISKRKEDKDFFKDTEILFAVLGEHRNLELNKIRAKDLFHNNNALCRTYVQWLDYLQSILEVENILKTYDTQNLDRLGNIIKSFMIETDDRKLGEQVKSIQEHYVRKIHGQMLHFRHHSHRIRKELKIIFYLYKISLTSQGSSEIQMKQLEKILELLGNIQDDEVSRNLVQRFYDRLYLKQDKKYLACIVKNIRHQKEEMLQKVHKKTSLYLSSFLPSFAYLLSPHGII